MTKFLKDVVERAVKTAAQAGVALIGAAEGFNAFELDYAEFGGVTLGAALLSVLSSLASRNAGDDKDSASLNRADHL